MSRLLQTEREAIELIRPDAGDESKAELRIFRNEQRRFYLVDEEIFLAGVSPGEGTCSLLHGIYIAVFEAQMPQRVYWPCMNVSKYLCSWAAFIRPPFPNERDPNDITALAVAEGLLIEEEGADFVRFRRSGKKQTYHPLV